MKSIPVYAATLNLDVYSGGAVVISLFLNKKDAENALKLEKDEFYKSENRDAYQYESWAVLKYELNADDSIIELIEGIKRVAQKISDNN